MNLFREFLSPYNWRHAWRDARPQWKSLLLYTSAVIAGVAALVAILSFRNDVLLTVEDQSRELLGADLEFRSTMEFPPRVVSYIDSIGGSDASSVEFNSMVQFLSSGDSRLSQIRAIDGPFPLYGSIKTNPEEAAKTYRDDRSALLEQSAMRQFGISVGDSIRVGGINIPVSGELISVPGESAAFSFVGPRVYLPLELLEGSGLLQRGSRVVYKEHLVTESAEQAQKIAEEFRPLGREYNVRTDTVQSRQEDFEAVVNNLGKFLGLIAFVALLLGGLGAASAVYVYIKRKTGEIATLRCIGMPKEKVLTIFSIQIAAIGLIGAIAGSAIGVLIQNWLPLLFTDLLPVDIVQAVSWTAIFLGIFIGVAVSLGFSLLPLLSVTGISPMLTLRSTKFSPLKNLAKRTKVTALLVTAVLLVLIIALLTESLVVSLVFALGVLAGVILLWAVALLLVSAVKGLRLKSLSYVWRQGTANLFRPNNQTPLLLTTIGMGMLLISTLYLSQETLLNSISMQMDEDVPNLVFYDVQMDQNDGVNRLVEEHGAKIMQNVPIVSMRLQSRKGVSVSELRADTTQEIRGWALSREYRVTYRRELRDSETLVSGEWIGEADGIAGTVPISISEQIRDELKIEVGDTLGFNVQGMPVTTVVASIRDVDFQRPEPNFFVVFPAGVLEQAPQFYATTVQTSGEDDTFALQQKVVSEFPNISVLDISIVINTVRDFLDRIAIAVRFMAFFSIITGLIVLASSISISRRQRTHESVLLRTLGGTKKQVGAIQTIEYLLLGTLATLTGLLLALGTGWLLATFYFDLPFVPEMGTLSLFSLFIILAALLIGWSGSRHIFNKPPNEILRLETG